MPLDDSFKYVMVGKSVRRVRTPAGAAFFNLPVGALITAEVMRASKDKHGHMALSRMLRAENGAGVGPGGDVVPDNGLSRRFDAPAVLDNKGSVLAIRRDLRDLKAAANRSFNAVHKPTTAGRRTS